MKKLVGSFRELANRLQEGTIIYMCSQVSNRTSFDDIILEKKKIYHYEVRHKYVIIPTVGWHTFKNVTGKVLSIRSWYSGILPTGVKTWHFQWNRMFSMLLWETTFRPALGLVYIRGLVHFVTSCVHHKESVFVFMKHAYKQNVYTEYKIPQWLQFLMKKVNFCIWNEIYNFPNSSA